MRIDLQQFLFILHRRKQAAIRAFVIVGLIVVFLGLVSTPRYDASALLLVGESLSDRPSSAEMTARQAEDNVVSLALIAGTDDVLGDAAQAVGWEKLFPGQQAQGGGDLRSMLHRLRVLIGMAEPAEGKAPATKNERIDLSPSARTERMAAQISSLQRAVVVRPEAKASLIRIVFGHRDPTIAAQFTNALARSLINRQVELWSRPGAVDFFQVQRKRFEEDMRIASGELTAFIATNSTYSVIDQRELLLKRASEVGAGLATTRGSIAERIGQKQALADQLKRLKPVAASPFVSNLVDALGTQDRDALGPQPKEDRSISNDPPLLLVKVYQDGLVQLMKVNSDLAGYNNLAFQQEKELRQIDEELASLSSKEAQFDKLKKAVEIASSNAETYSKRMVEEQISADLAKAKMSGLRLVQSAIVPVKPAFPKLQLLMAGAIIAGILAAILTAALLEVQTLGLVLTPGALSKSRQQEEDEASSNAPTTVPVDENLRLYKRF